MQFIQTRESIKLTSLLFARHGPREVLQRLIQVGHERPLIRGGKKARPVLPCPFNDRPRPDRDEAGQITVLGPQSVGDPGPQARPRRDSLAGVHQQATTGMIRIVGDHRADHAQVVHTLRGVWKEFADVESR